MSDFEAYSKHVQARKAALQSALAAQLTNKPPIVLEIGSGHGHFLSAYATAHPDLTCVGIDLVTSRIFKSDRKRKMGELDNLLFYKAEANEFLECAPVSLQIQRIFVLFPDPWPKKRHVKNRLLQPQFLDRLARRCQPGAELHFRTDHLPYYSWALERIAESPAWNVTPDAPLPFESPTYFQSLASQWHTALATRTETPL